MRTIQQCAIAFLAAAATACASAGGRPPFTLPPIVIAAPGPSTPAPVEEKPAPRATIAFLVVDQDTGAPISSAFAFFEDGVTLQARADGYISRELAAGGAVYAIRFEADGYTTMARRFQVGSRPDERDGAGNRQWSVTMKSTKTPEPAAPVVPPNVDYECYLAARGRAGDLARAYQECVARKAPQPPVVVETPPPPPAPVPPIAVGVPACGTAENTLRVSHACLAAVAETSKFYPGCQAGSQHDCHYYVREVAVALRTAQNDPRWGLIRKTQGGANVEGYGEDVVAYLPAPFSLDAHTWQWRGADIVGGAGAPGARFIAGELHDAVACPPPTGSSWCNRTTDLWAPVPAASTKEARLRWPRFLSPSAALSRSPSLAWQAPRKQSAPFPRWKLRAGLVFSMACQGADLSITQFMLGRYPDTFREGNPVLAWIHDPVWFGIAKLGAASGLSWWQIELAEDHPRAAFWASMATGTATCYFANRNARTAGLR